MTKQQIDELLSEFEDRFNHFNDYSLSRPPEDMKDDPRLKEKLGRQICSWDCEEEYDLDDIQIWLRERLEKLL